jgi:hypothetical protein
LRDRSIDGGVDLLDDAMPSCVELVDRSLGLGDGRVVSAGTACIVFQVPLIEVAAQQIEQPTVEASRWSVFRIAEGASELGHDVFARREIVVRRRGSRAHDRPSR